VLREIREPVSARGSPPSRGPVRRSHLEVITHAVGALKTVEIGTLAAYSGGVPLRAWDRTACCNTFEYSEKHARVAAESFRKAGVASRAHIHVGPALIASRDRGGGAVRFVSSTPTR